jgi:predicted O-linked N-acetylglucosamine transferase (SPINDLY family)
VNEILMQSAVRAHQAGNFAEAARLYGEILRGDPRHFGALYALGFLYYQAGQFEEAQRIIGEAIRINPRSPDAFFRRGCALQRLNRAAEALICFDQALALRPNFADAQSDRGMALMALNRNEAALESLDAALALDPSNAAAWSNRGSVLKILGRHDEALVCFDKAIPTSQAQAATQLPDSAIAAFRQGCTLLGLNKPADALACFEQALSIAPYFVEALTNRGALLLTLKKHEKALQSLDAALAINPSMVEAWNNRGNALSELGRYDEAVASYDKVLAARPGIFETLVNRGTALLALRRAEDALASYDDALRASPDSDDALNGRANALFELKRFDEANREYERILKRNPDRPYAAGILAFSRLHCCDWRTLDEDREKVAAGIRARKRAVNPFQNLALSRLPEEQKQCAAIWVADKYPPSPEPIWKGGTYAHERIRLAYLSAELRDHAVAQTIAGVFEHHDRARFETIAISWGARDSGPMRTRLAGAFEHFIDMEGQSDREVAHRLRDLEVDIAIDLMGFTGECRPGILAWRAAPVQVNYLGFPGTMAAPYIDYMLADRIVIPEDEQHHYSEKIVYLPDSYLPNDSRRRIANNVPTREQAGLPETGFVFASFNNSYKFTPELFDIWMRLLRAVQGSVLWLSAANPAAAQNLRREAEARGIDVARLVIAPYLSSSEDHIARIGLADLFLDTLPYNAHATAADALRVGLPVLTCKGTTFAGRVAASLLHSAGVPELITDSLASYEALALRLACEPSVLAPLKTKLAANRSTQAFFDTARFTRNLEAALLSICERRQTIG